jgi:DNA-binding NarL/FixJ family response regulator
VPIPHAAVDEFLNILQRRFDISPMSLYKYPPAVFPAASAARESIETPANQRGTHTSRREEDVLRELLDGGKSNKAIAHVLGLREMTVKAYFRRLSQKLGAGNRVEIALWAERRATSNVNGLMGKETASYSIRTPPDPFPAGQERLKGT